MAYHGDIQGHGSFRTILKVLPMVTPAPLSDPLFSPSTLLPFANIFANELLSTKSYAKVLEGIQRG